MSGWKPRSVSLSSGGAKAIGQLGVLARLLESGVLDEVRDWYGCSGGSLGALFCALGVSAAWIRDVAEHFDMASTVEISDDPVESFSQRWGVANSEFTRTFLGRFVDTWEPGASAWTFADLRRERGVGLHVIATNVTQGVQAVFDATLTPDMRILDAVMASCAVPLFFTPWIGSNGDVYTDGAVIEYYPWRCVEDKDNTLVIVCEEQGIHGRAISFEIPPATVSEFVERLLRIARRGGLRTQGTPPRNWIALNNHDIGALEIHMTRENRLALFRGGERAAAGWLAFRAQRITDSVEETGGSRQQCEDQNTSSSAHPSPDKRSDNHQSQTPQPQVRSSPGSHTGERPISRRWSV